MLDRWVYQPGIPPNMVRPPADTFAAQDKAAANFARASARARRLGAAGPPTSGCASSTGCRASSARPGSTSSQAASGSTRATQQGDPLRLARSGGRQPLRSGGALARAVPDLAGPRQVREAADHARSPRIAMGQADRQANLRRGAAALSPAGDPRPRQVEPSSKRGGCLGGTERTALTALKRSLAIPSARHVERRADVRSSRSL